MFNHQLITGIPRSGTTLCCKLLNQSKDIIALHEPINPGTWPKNFSTTQAVETIQRQIDDFYSAIVTGQPFENGEQQGLLIDNPVGTESKGGIRQVVARRGQLTLEPRPAGSFHLVVKQNALFTALLPELASQYPMVCIVRNPVDVLLSWMTVDLPVNRGRVPAGERFSQQLRYALENKSVIDKQLVIYQWFIDKFMDSSLPVVRYEDVLVTGGGALHVALGLPEIAQAPLKKKHRKFQPHIIEQLTHCIDKIKNLSLYGLYSKESIQLAYDEVINQ
ncbi:sulfotransferase domain-containing protein [Neptunicella marina]|uniref:Sulfotransferase domain-containing protein n=1 Tax=Neptunicella marina TaxID=2125989 RepID=A0A8J6LXN9_9ALTE|nr:sulfotransferase domain-containing protein [Neptunicella marina]MBC3764930.1 sulfotransferase domain-containing protein [Neptunicella marina]